MTDEKIITWDKSLDEKLYAVQQLCAALVAEATAAEREACADIVDSFAKATEPGKFTSGDMASAIMRGRVAIAQAIAAAIRARGACKNDRQ